MNTRIPATLRGCFKPHEAAVTVDPTMARRLQGCWPFRALQSFSRRCRSRSFASHYRRKKYGSQWDFRPRIQRETVHIDKLRPRNPFTFFFLCHPERSAAKMYFDNRLRARSRRAPTKCPLPCRCREFSPYRLTLSCIRFH